MIFTVTNRSRVSKLPTGKWLSKNATQPPKVFDTWREAMDWASWRFTMMNAAR